MERAFVAGMTMALMPFAMTLMVIVSTLIRRGGEWLIRKLISQIRTVWSRAHHHEPERISGIRGFLPRD